MLLSLEQRSAKATDNHFSGNLHSSKMEKTLTQLSKKSGDMLDITLEDHINLTADG